MATRPRSLGVILGLFGLSVLPAPVSAQTLGGDELRAALTDTAADFWVYDDLKAAKKQAVEAGKPLLVSFRCVP